MTRSLVGQQLVAFLAAALEAAHRVSTHVITPPVVETALVNVCGQKIMHSGRIKPFITKWKSAEIKLVFKVRGKHNTLYSSFQQTGNNLFIHPACSNVISHLFLFRSTNISLCVALTGRCSHTEKPRGRQLQFIIVRLPSVSLLFISAANNQQRRRVLIPTFARCFAVAAAPINSESSSSSQTRRLPLD